MFLFRSSQATANAPQDIHEVNARMASITHKILVLSGKGGVGKSTVSAHLAHGLAADPNCQVRLSFALFHQKTSRLRLFYLLKHFIFVW
jgi:hypothetical protein